MNLDEYTIKLEECLKRQLEAFSNFYTAEEKLKQQVASKNWSELNNEIVYLQQQAEEIDKIEIERNNIYNAMKFCCNDNSANDFYSFISKYCPEKSIYLNALYKDLKVSVVKVKALTMRIDAYLSAITATITKVFEEVFPMGKGTIYDNKGANKVAIAPPFLLDKQL